MSSSSEPGAAESAPSWRRKLAALRLDITPLKTSRDFRLLWSAGTVFYLGAMVAYVALPYQLYDLTKSNFAVGALGLVQLIPLIVAGLYGGVLADRLDRRLVMVYTGVAQFVLAGALLANALLEHPSVWAIYVIGGLYSIASSLQRPSREALIPRTVRHDELPAAVTLASFGVQVGMLTGPAVGGLLIAQAGLPWAYAVVVIGYAIATGLLALLRPYAPTEQADEGNGPLATLRSIGDGLTYAVRRKDLLGTYVVDLVAMLMAMPTVLWPAFAQDVLHQPTTLGLMYSAGTVGSLLATATSGWTNRVHHHGRAVVLAAAAWGASIVVAGLSPSVWLALFALLLAGAFDLISGVFRSIIWNQTIPDERRGRLAGIEMLSYSIGPLGGEARAGLVADATSVRASIVSGGVLCVAGVALVAAWLRDFWTYDARTDEHAVRERELREARAAEEAKTAAEAGIGTGDVRDVTAEHAGASPGA
ncbi:MFS transporter [Flindersiella endophytica]